MKHAILILMAAVALSGCGGGTKVMVPPRIDLQEHEILGIIEFGCTKEGELGPLATQRFLDAARVDQGLVRIVDLGTEKEALREIRRKRLNRGAYQAFAAEHELKTIFIGELVVSDIRPAVSITSDLKNIGAGADVDATLTVHMVETESGASVWSRSASVTKRVGEIGLFGGTDVVFDAEDPERAYGELVDALVTEVTYDFRLTWARQ